MVPAAALLLAAVVVVGLLVMLAPHDIWPSQPASPETPSQQGCEGEECSPAGGEESGAGETGQQPVPPAGPETGQQPSGSEPVQDWEELSKEQQQAPDPEQFIRETCEQNRGGWPSSCGWLAEGGEKDWCEKCFARGIV